MHLSTSIHMPCPAACSYIFTLLQARTAAVAHGWGVWLPGLQHVWQLIPINCAQACRSQPWTSVGWKSGGLHEVPLPPRRAGQGHFSLSMLCSKHTFLWLLCMLACVAGPPLAMAPIHAPYCSCSVPGGSWARLSGSSQEGHCRWLRSRAEGHGRRPCQGHSTTSATRRHKGLSRVLEDVRRWQTDERGTSDW